jgi:hypothetical protein
MEKCVLEKDTVSSSYAEKRQWFGAGRARLAVQKTASRDFDFFRDECTLILFFFFLFFLDACKSALPLSPVFSREA